ncbi:hypothetical protein CDAR_51421 [Caerostris darwini]|uniref:Uncharacterized protein n=1 Tax=Caerostris darwini TaxID=1538125 RepID=A0AAV4U619_9ARAC|nr:hypothetical protein CDAR_51421 [Caerostris darwini]
MFPSAFHSSYVEISNHSSLINGRFGGEECSMSSRTFPSMSAHLSPSCSHSSITTNISVNDVRQNILLLARKKSLLPRGHSPDGHPRGASNRLRLRSVREKGPPLEVGGKVSAGTSAPSSRTGKAVFILDCFNRNLHLSRVEISDPETQTIVISTLASFDFITDKAEDKAGARSSEISPPPGHSPDGHRRGCFEVSGIAPCQRKH